MGWNIVLGDPIRKSLDDEGDQDMESNLGNDEHEDSDMYMDEDEDDQLDNLPSTSSLKRRRATPSAMPRPSNSRSQNKSSSQKKMTNARPPSLEQIEYISLLATLLCFPSAPLLSPHNPYLAGSILRRLNRFIQVYPTDTSMHHDYINVLSATLSYLSLNKKSEVTAFAAGAWDSLVDLWSTKNKRMKEGLVGILRILFPFYTASSDMSSATLPRVDCSSGINKLWHLLDGEAESRWGVDGLSLDCLRLELRSFEAGDEADSETAAFSKATFRAGWHFDASQALVWAILELQADGADKVPVLLVMIEFALSKIFAALQVIGIRSC